MAYRQPADYLTSYFQPQSASLIKGIELAENRSRFADKKRRLDLQSAESQRRYDFSKPLVEAQIHAVQQKSEQAEEAKRLYHRLMGGEGDPLQGDMTLESLMKNPIKRAVIKSRTGIDIPAAAKKQYDAMTVYGPKSETKRVYPEKGKPYTPPAGWTIGQTKETTPQNQMAQIKLEALQRYYSGSATAEDINFLNVNDPYLARAAQFVSDDLKMLRATPEEKVAETIRLADLLRASQVGAGGPAAATGAPNPAATVQTPEDAAKDKAFLEQIKVLLGGQ